MCDAENCLVVCHRVIRLLDASTGAPAASLPELEQAEGGGGGAPAACCAAHECSVTLLQFAPLSLLGGAILVSGSSDGNVCLWDTGRGRRCASVSHHHRCAQLHACVAWRAAFILCPTWLGVLLLSSESTSLPGQRRLTVPPPRPLITTTAGLSTPAASLMTAAAAAGGWPRRGTTAA